MNKVRVTKKFRFEMAHMLPYHQGLCRNIHGHSYNLDVTVRGKVKHEKFEPEDGMVMDFSVLKQIVKEMVLDKYDHSLVLPSTAIGSIEQDTRLSYIEGSPTCEMLLLEFVSRVRGRLPQGVELVSMKLSETSSSYAEWLLEDNIR